MIKACKYDDKSAMLDECKKKSEEVMKKTETGMKIRSGTGKANLQEMGMKMRHCGDLLNKKGQQ